MRRMIVVFLILVLVPGMSLALSRAFAQGGNLPETALFPNLKAASSSQLVDYLKDERNAYRASSARELGRRKEKSAVAPLRKLLQDEFPFVQVQAAEALFALGDDSGIQTLHAVLASPSASSGTALIAARLLAEHGDSAGEALAQSKLGSKYGSERLQAISVLRHNKNDDIAFAALQIGLGDTSDLVRTAAEWALGERGTPRSVRMLQPLLGAAKKEERSLVATVIGRTRMYDGIPVLLGALNDPEWIVRSTAVSQLEVVTGQKFPIDDSMKSDAATQKAIAQQWNDWWDKNKASYPPGTKSPIPVAPLPPANR